MGDEPSDNFRKKSDENTDFENRSLFAILSPNFETLALSIAQLCIMRMIAFIRKHEMIMSVWLLR
jgi:hypothetical protein